MKIPCTFYDFNWLPKNQEYYTCRIENCALKGSVEFKLAGKHVKYRKNNDVEALLLKGPNVPEKLHGIAKLFSNLKCLTIQDSNLKVIQREDLKGLEDIQEINVFRNPIESLPENLFEDLKKLETIYFAYNQIKFIHPNILDRLENLRYVNFRNNPSISTCFSTYKQGKNNYERTITLEELKQVLIDKFSPHITGTSQHYNLGLFNDLKTFLGNEKWKDLTIVVNNEEFKVHKFLLVTRSTAFAEMFENNPHADTLNLTDISNETFRLILKYFYTDELPNDDDTNFYDLFIAAVKLKVENLEKLAANKIKPKASDGFDELLKILVASNKFEQETLTLKTFEEIKKIYPNVNIKDKYAKHPDKLKKLIDFYRDYEDKVKMLEIDFD